MNARILELIKNPEIIQHQDLDLLNAEITKNPYLQSIRAMHLSGTHQFNADNYQKELSVTAAYTTDKKILYQLINKKTSENFIEKKTEILEKETIETSANSVYNEVNLIPKPVAKPVFVDGILNRILFEGEEDFLDRETETIDLESTLESGTIVTQNTVKENITKPNESLEASEFNEAKDAESFSTEAIINELEIKNEEPKIESAEISFHGLEEFLPEVKITTNTSESEKYKTPKPQTNKHEIEMQRLIAEVEAKMKVSKKEKVQEIEPVQNSDINFSETQNFEVTPSQNKIITPEKSLEIVSEEKPDSENKLQNQENSAEKIQINTEITQKTNETEKSTWKPMQFSGNLPDSLIDKKAELKTEEKPLSIEKVEPVSKEETTIEKTEERPVFNVSFFTQNVSSITSEKPVDEKKKSEEKIAVIEDSNIPTFINTWQKWLKIDRNTTEIEEKPSVSKEEVKNTVIEKFIEKEPKISKLKEESDFVVKEKGSNISHLMTETLANLYVEQKLYAKAIKGYETLIEKHPQKTDLFKEKIQEIKELRKNP